MSLLNRRNFLIGASAVLGTTALAACDTNSPSPTSPTPTRTGGYLTMSDPAIAAYESSLPVTGRTRQVEMTAAPRTIDIAGKRADTWAFADTLAANEIRATAGDVIAVSLRNQLPAATSIHWHGVALRCDMDGVPPLTQPFVAPNSRFDYRFVAPHPGTYWFHPHVGVQLDRGLYSPLIIEDPHEPLRYDEEWVVVLDDWLDGISGTPDQVLSELSHGMGDMGGMDDMGGTGGMNQGGGMSSGHMLMGSHSDVLGGDAGDVNYPIHLINGRSSADPAVFTGSPGKRVRIRIINAGGDTAYRVALGGHSMTITHTDGYPVTHQDTDALLLGMGERYDVLVTLADSVFPLVAEAEGKQMRAMALVKTGTGTAPTPSVTVPQLTGRLVTAAMLRADEAVRLPARKPDRTIDINLTGGMDKYDWALNGQKFDLRDPMRNPFGVTSGERIRIQWHNTTMMWHPMHLHGHSYQLGDTGPRKDTTIVLPGQTVTTDFDANNPGRWLTHCHNAYHGESGMMGVIAYQH